MDRDDAIRPIAETFLVPIEQRRFEDYRPGARYEFPETVSLTEAEITRFAEEYDPQYLHLDRTLAAEGPFGGLIASGWQTAALMMRLYARHYLPGVASLGGPGIDELRWLLPVRAGDVLHLRVEILAARPSKSKPDRGLVGTRTELVDQEGRPVLRATALNFIRRREAASAQASQPG